MKRYLHSFSWREKAQAMVEFALVFPVLLLLIYGIIELGRLIFIYTSVTTSSREAARYGSAAGRVGGTTPRYLDCAGILAAAQRSAILTPVNAGNITITYDHGPGSSLIAPSCPAAQTQTIVLGDRINVQVTVNYTPLMPIVQFASFPITSTTNRTILKSVEIKGTPIADDMGNPTVRFELDSQTCDEPNCQAIRVTLSVLPANPVTVGLKFGGTAVNGADYSIVTSPLVFNVGEVVKNLVLVTNDDIDEWDETIEILIESASNANIDQDHKTHTTTIQDDDPEALVQFSTASLSVDEGSGAFVIVSLDNPQGSGKNIFVPYSQTAGDASSLDYTLSPNTLSFEIPAGSVTAQVWLATVVDSMDENGVETAVFTLGAPANAQLGAQTTSTVSIVDKDLPPTVSWDLESQKGVEGVTLKLKAILSAPSSKEVSVPFTVQVITATLGVDFTMGASPLIIPPMSTEGEIEIVLIDEGPTSLPEPDEDFQVVMGTPINATAVEPTTHTVTILAFGEKPIVNFESNGGNTLEKDGDVGIRFVLDHAWNQVVTVPYTIIGGTAVGGGADYSAEVNGTVTIPVGSLYGLVKITLIEDLIDEPDETIILQMGAPTNATKGTVLQYVLSIVDNDDAPFVSFALATSQAMEDGGPINVQVLLSSMSTREITIPYTVSGTATAGADRDYTIPASPLVIPAGSVSGTIVINVVDDAVPGEGNETVILTIGTPTNAIKALPDVHTATIQDDDICPSLYSRNVVPGAGRRYFTIGLMYPDLTQPTITITQIEIDWDSSPSQKVDRVDWIANPIYNTKTNADPLRITSFVGPESYRTYAPSTLERLLAVYFEKDMTGTAADYSVTITFNNGCTVP
jgi:Flp pilus assembly protein TadG